MYVCCFYGDCRLLLCCLRMERTWIPEIIVVRYEISICFSSWLLPFFFFFFFIVCSFESDRGFEIWFGNFRRSTRFSVWFWNYLVSKNWRIEICWMIKNGWIRFRFYCWEIVFVDGIDASMSIRALGSCADSPALQMQCEIALQYFSLFPFSIVFATMLLSFERGLIDALICFNEETRGSFVIFLSCCILKPFSRIT